jgi:Ca-activated chloride channel family protein
VIAPPVALSFAEPVALSGLVLVPLAVLAYAALQRRRAREAAAWANPALAPGLVTADPGWRRHVPAALLLASLATLVVALAKPQRTVAAPERAATVVLVTDVSGSMEATDVAPTRLDAAIRAARTLSDELPKTFRLGLVAFSDRAEQRAAPTTDRAAVNAALESLLPLGGTATGEGLARGLEAARTPVPGPDGRPRRLPAVIVLLSDGKQTAGVEDPLRVADRANRLRIPIYTIALGTPDGTVQQPGTFGLPQSVPVPPDPATMRAIARASGGRFFEAPTADDLESIYGRLGTRLSSRTEQREVTVAFAGGGLLLLLVSGALSLRWFGRLP